MKTPEDYQTTVKALISGYVTEVANLMGNADAFSSIDANEYYRDLRARRSSWDPDKRNVFDRKPVAMALAILVAVIDLYINYRTNAMYKDISSMNTLDRYLIPTILAVLLLGWIVGCARTHHIIEKMG